MPATYRLDLALRVVWSRGWGALRDDELAAHSRALRADPRFEPSFRQIQDLTDVATFDVTSAGLRLVAQLNPFGEGARRAVVVPSDVGFGLARMHEQIRMGDAADQLRVFRELRSAMEWLDLPLDWVPPQPTPTDPLFDSTGDPKRA